MKKLMFLAFLLSLPADWVQQTPPAPSAGKVSEQQMPAQTQVRAGAPELMPASDLPGPERYAVSFLPLDKGNEGIAFLVAPDGKAGTLPIRNLSEAFKAGYRPFTVADLLAAANAVVDDQRNLQKRYKELAEDYDALVARYNRLAAVNTAVPVQTQPAVDERQVMRSMVFRALLQRTFPPPPTQINVRTVDCTKFPALCVSH